MAAAEGAAEFATPKAEGPARAAGAAAARSKAAAALAAALAAAAALAFCVKAARDDSAMVGPAAGACGNPPVAPSMHLHLSGGQKEAAQLFVHLNGLIKTFNATPPSHRAVHRRNYPAPSVLHMLCAPAVEVGIAFVHLAHLLCVCLR